MNNRINNKDTSMAALVIDASYVVKSTSQKIDYLKLKKAIEDIYETKIGEGFYFNSFSNGKFNEDQDRFHNWLKTAEPLGPKIQVMLYPIKESHTKCGGCGADAVKMVQKGVDVGIAATMCRLAFTSNVHTIFLVAGDGDLKDAIDTAKLGGVKFVSLGFKNTLSPDLQAASHEVLFLDDIIKLISK